jgi:hypothetical protein
MSAIKYLNFSWEIRPHTMLSFSQIESMACQ